ncbi:tetratricopeptide repeat protein [bacterium]|nr:tetratricopeptide repeat protein [bacterium]
MKKGIEYFQQAIQKDPNYALAYAGLSDCYTVAAFYGFMAQKESLEKVREAAMRALELDDTLAEAHTSFATVKEDLEWDLQGAEKEYLRAIDLNPNYATARHWYSINLGRQERNEEGLAQIKRALEVDPLSLIINVNVGYGLLQAGRTNEGAQACRRTIELDSNFPQGHSCLGRAYRDQGRYSEALAEYQKEFDLSGDREDFLQDTGIVLAMSGKREEARERLTELIELSKSQHVSPITTASLYAGLGEADRAFEMLEKAYQEHDMRLVGIKVSRSLDSLRSDPRYKDLLRRIGLPE